MIDENSVLCVPSHETGSPSFNQSALKSYLVQEGNFWIMATSLREEKGCVYTVKSMLIIWILEASKMQWNAEMNFFSFLKEKMMFQKCFRNKIRNCFIYAENDRSRRLQEIRATKMLGQIIVNLWEKMLLLCIWPNRWISA